MKLSRFDVSVIVVNYNCHTTLEDCIRSILLSKAVVELLLVDNASTDGSMDLIEKYTADARLKIIRLDRNIGLAEARNLAAAKTSSDYLAFVDADTVVDPEWLQEPCFLLETHKKIGAVQCKVLSFRHPNLISEQISFVGNVVAGSDLFSMPKETLNVNRFILFPIGACIITRRDVWNHVLGFDPAFFVGHDDIDLGMRLWLSGYTVIRSSRGIVYHDGGHLRFRKDIAPIFHFYGGRNMLSIWTKDLQGKTLVKQVLPFSLLYPFQACWHGGGIVGIIGVISFLKILPSILVKRQEMQKLRKISDEKIMPMLREWELLPVLQFTEDFRAAYKYVSRKIRLFVQKSSQHSRHYSSIMEDKSTMQTLQTPY